MNTNKPQLNLAIVGLGGMGNWHRETIATIDGLSVCGSFDIKAERQQFARDHGVNPYESLEAVLSDPNVDIVLCATPNDLHKAIVIRALQAGKHVVCEKPVALSASELQQMIDAANTANRLFTVHQNRRWDEDFLTMKNIFDQRLLGETFRVESRVHGSRGIPGDWRHEKEHGGGMVLDWGVHIIDQMLMMIPGKVSKIFASVSHITNELVDDGFCAEFLFESGFRALIEVGTSNFIALPRWYMLGRDGTAVIHDWSLKGEMVRITDWSKNDAVPIRTAAGLTKTMAPRTEETIKTQPLPIVRDDIRGFYKNVLATIRGEAPSLVTHGQMMRVMRAMEAIFESADKQQVVDFE